ncbi:MAG: hypothetical protein K2X36_04445, partial [Microbacteriaceae bacterium]|nr:hypothetical protein [Microbacteriaceae bacterium]
MREIAEPGREVMRQLDSGGWVHVYTDDGRPYVLLNRWVNGNRAPGYRKEHVTGRQRMHIRARHELIPGDFDEYDNEPLFALEAELESLGYAVLIWVSSFRDGHKHFHFLVATESLERRLFAEHLIAQRLGKHVLKREGLSCPGFAGKVEWDGETYRKVWDVKKQSWVRTRDYDHTEKLRMRKIQDDRLEFLHAILAFLRACPRWEMPASPPSSPMPPPSLRAPSSAPIVRLDVRPAEDIIVLDDLLDFEVDEDEPQSYDTFERTPAMRHRWKILRTAQCAGISRVDLWAQRHRPGMAGFKSEKQFNREWQKAEREASSFKKGEDYIRTGLAAQVDPELTEMKKRLILHL